MAKSIRDVRVVWRLGRRVAVALGGRHELSEVGVGDLATGLGQALKTRPGGLLNLPARLELETVQAVAERVAARAGREHDARLVEPDVLGPHDLVARTLPEHALLLDRAGVRESVRPDHRLVRLDGRPGQLGDEARRAHALARVDARRETAALAADLEEHHDLLE